jgi:hypothetical protein
MTSSSVCQRDERFAHLGSNGRMSSRLCLVSHLLGSVRDRVDVLPHLVSNLNFDQDF